MLITNNSYHYNALKRELFSLTYLKDIVRFVERVFSNSDLFYGHSTATPEVEAGFLVESVMNLPINSILVYLDNACNDTALSSTEKESLLDKIFLRIMSKLPLPYILNQVYYVGLRLYVDRRVIIPRSTIAEIIISKFNPWIKVANTKRINILDMCTGSGCIAIACAKYVSRSIVDAVDISKDALNVAKQNLKDLSLEKKINLIQSDLFEYADARSKKPKYDIIIANPPYLTAREVDAFPEEYHFEPKISLVADDADGLSIVFKIIKQAHKYLKPSGILIIESSQDSNLKIEELFRTMRTVYRELVWYAPIAGDADIAIFSAF